jgi:hypothetical protein
MTFDQAIAQQPAWVGYWLNWLLFGAFILPLALLIWRQSRIAAIATIVTSITGAFGVNWLFGWMGYVKLLGLPHIVLWTPLAYYLFVQIKRDDMPAWPKRIIVVVLATILISLAFDYADVLRYALGERMPFAKPA